MSLLRIIFHPVSPLRRFVSLAFRPVLPVECPFLSPSFLPPSVFTVHASLVRLSWNTTVSFPLVHPEENGGENFLPPTFGALCDLSSQPSLSPSLFLSVSRARRLSLDPANPGPFSPLRLYTAPNLNPIFHITSRKSYSAALGWAGSSATRDSPPAREGTTKCFYLLFASFSPSHHSSCPPSLSFSRVARSKTISEHIARVRLRSPFPVRLLAMSSRLFDPRGRRNNACTSPLSLVVPLVVVLAAQPSLLAFRCAKDFLTERSSRESG